MQISEYPNLVVVRWKGKLFHIEDYFSEVFGYNSQQRIDFKNTWQKDNGKAEVIKELRGQLEQHPAKCVSCEKEVSVKMGPTRRPHFAHFHGDAEKCHQFADEDPQKQEAHYRWEKYFENLFQNQGLDIELEQGLQTPDGPYESIRPDLFVESDEHEVGFEVQLSNITEENLMKKLEGYRSLDLRVFYFTPNDTVFEMCKRLKIPAVYSTIELAPDNNNEVFQVRGKRGRKFRSDQIIGVLFAKNKPDQLSEIDPETLERIYASEDAFWKTAGKIFWGAVAFGLFFFILGRLFRRKGTSLVICFMLAAGLALSKECVDSGFKPIEIEA